MLEIIKYDIGLNKSSFKSLYIVLFFRLSSYFALHTNKLIRIVGIPIRILYKLIIEFLMSVELPDKTQTGKGLKIFHGMGLVVNDKVILGDNITLRQNTTIGSKYDGGLCPIIEDNVNIGANVVLIGDIVIGKNSIVGAGSVVTKSFSENSVIIGNPARQIKKDT